MTDAFTAAGFRISVISEPAVAPDTPRELLPDKIADNPRLLCFLFLSCRPTNRRGDFLAGSCLLWASSRWKANLSPMVPPAILRSNWSSVAGSPRTFRPAVIS
jgi:hypothetical protein